MAVGASAVGDIGRGGGRHDADRPHSLPLGAPSARLGSHITDCLDHGSRDVLSLVGGEGTAGVRVRCELSLHKEVGELPDCAGNRHPEAREEGALDVFGGGYYALDPTSIDG